MRGAMVGPLGALRALPGLAPGSSVSAERAGSSWTTLGGYGVEQSSPRARRSWDVQTRFLTPAEMAYLVACARRAVPGPLYLHTREAALTNLLPSAVASPCEAGTAALGSVAGSVLVGLADGTVPMSGVVQQASAGPWTATVPIRQVSHVLSGWASAAGVAVEWRTVTAAGLPVASGTVTAAAVSGGFYGAASIVPGATVAGVQVRLAAGSRTVGGLRLVEGVRPEDGPLVATNLATNPSFEATSGTVEVRRNFFPNPLVATGSGWGAYYGAGGVGAAAVVATTGYPSGLASAYRATWTTAPTANGGGLVLGNGASSAPATPGLAYTGSAHIRSSSARSIVARIDWRDAAGSALSTTTGATVALGSSEVRRLSVTGTAPAGAAYAAVTFYSTTNPAVGDWIEAAGGIWEQSSVLGGFFAPGLPSPDSDLTPAWAGTANASASVLTGVAVTGFNDGFPDRARRFSSQQWAAHGTRSVRVSPRSTDPAVTYAETSVAGLTVGQTYTLIGRVRLASPQTGTLAAMARRFWVTQGGDPAVTHLATAPNEAGVHEVRGTFVAAATTHGVRLMNGAAVGGGDVWWGNLAIIEGVYTGPWFDGSNPPAGMYTAWTGTANASTSISKAIPADAVTETWLPGVGVPQIVVSDPQQTLQLVTAGDVRSDYTVTIREVG